MANPRSTTSIAGHPIHPMLIPFVATLACDLAFWQMGGAYWQTTSLLFLGAGLAMAAVAAIAGLVKFLPSPRLPTFRDVRWYVGGNVLAVLIQSYNVYARVIEGPAAVVPQGLILSAIVVGLLLFTDWKAWERLYRHHLGDWSPAGLTTRRSPPGTGR